MAPVPEDNQDTPSNGNKDDSEHLSNPNLTIPVGGSDSSDSDDNEENFGAPGGYSLLPQEPDDNSFDSDYENIYSTESIGDNSYNMPSIPTDNLVSGGEDAPTDTLTESVMSSEEGAIAPTVPASNELYHPAFLARFPDGKIPSYMQVPKIPRGKEEHPRNQQRNESNKLILDPVHEAKILKAMSQFSLPTENVPDWARNLSDDQWHQQALNRIGIGSGRVKHSDNTRLSTPSCCTQDKAQTKDILATDDVWVADFADAATSDTGQK